MSLPVIDAQICNGCKACVEICPTGVYAMRDGKAVVVAPEDCTDCEACVSDCPVTPKTGCASNGHSVK